MSAQPVVGAVVPRGWRLGAALSAGLLWVTALALLLPLPSMVRSAHLYRERTDEGIGFFVVGLDLLAATALLALAHAVSVAGHGGSAQAPRAVRWCRRLTWLLLALMWTTAMVLPDVLHGRCFATCAPFPR